MTQKPNNDIELLPCPFCDAPAKYCFANRNGRDFHRIICTADGGICMDATFIDYDSKEEAFKHWNTQGSIEAVYLPAGTWSEAKAIMDAIIILDDDAEPELYDVVLHGATKGNNCAGMPQLIVTQEIFDKNLDPCTLPLGWNRYNDTPFMIIQRNGKPCIYRSTLTSAANANVNGGFSESKI